MRGFRRSRAKRILMNVVNNPYACPSFDGCEATLCPLDPSCGAGAIWYPDEPVCNAHRMKRLHPWIKIQRRIAKKHCDPNRFFTVRMLESIKDVHGTLKGLDPNGRQSEEAWIQSRLKARRRSMAEKPRSSALGKEIGAPTNEIYAGQRTKMPAHSV
jgi:hypothetical protein